MEHPLRASARRAMMTIAMPMQHDTVLASDIDPFRLPSWRFALAVQMHEQRKRARKRNDKWIELALQYLRRRDQEQSGRCRRALPGQLAAVEQAWKVYQANDALRWHLEARLLTSEPLEETSRACGIGVSTVEAYEALFFQVKDRLHAGDHIAQRVLPRRAALGIDLRDTPGLLKIVAYRGGHLALERGRRVLLPSGNSPPLDSQVCSKEVLVERSLDVGFRIYLLGLCVPVEGSRKCLLRLGMLQQLSEAWHQLHQEILSVRFSNPGRAIRTCLEEQILQVPACSPCCKEKDREDMAACLSLVQQATDQVWQAAVAGWAA
jgi:hypothetical protein